MKENMASLKSFKQLRGSSIMESVIAISIISVCALVAFTIYLNVVKQQKSVHYFNAKHRINFLAQQIIQTEDYEDDFYSFKGYTIDKEVSINKSDGSTLLAFTLNINDNTFIINKIISNVN